MAKKAIGKELGTTGKVLIGAGVVLLVIGGVWLYKRNKKKKECAKNGGTWNSKTNSCDLPKNNAKILKDAYDNLTFEIGKAIIKPTSFPYLDELVTVIQDPDALTWSLEIQGHTDNKGGDDYNQKLSEARANAVKKYLVDKGVKAERVIAKGFGLSKPIASNDTAEGREKNRRVEFIIRKPDAAAPISDQSKKAWLDKQAVDLPSVTDKKRFELFTKIPNFEKGILAIKDIEDLKKMGYKNIDLFPAPNYLRWSLESDWLANKAHLTQYVENGNIVKLNKDTKAFDLIGKWK